MKSHATWARKESLRVDKMPSKCLLFGRHRGRIYVWDTVQILQTTTTVSGLLHTGKGILVDNNYFGRKLSITGWFDEGCKLFRQKF